MLMSIQGIYRNGKIELVELPSSLPDETQVIVTFLSPNAVHLSDHGIDKTQAEELRNRLGSFAEGWNIPEMDVYDHYDSAKANL
jgi:hypothetical protein